MRHKSTEVLKSGAAIFDSGVRSWGCEIRPTFRVGNPTSVRFPAAELSTWNLEIPTSEYKWKAPLFSVLLNNSSVLHYFVSSEDVKGDKHPGDLCVLSLQILHHNQGHSTTRCCSVPLPHSEPLLPQLRFSRCGSVSLHQPPSSSDLRQPDTKTTSWKKRQSHAWLDATKKGQGGAAKSERGRRGGVRRCVAYRGEKDKWQKPIRFMPTKGPGPHVENTTVCQAHGMSLCMKERKSVFSSDQHLSSAPDGPAALFSAQWGLYSLWTIVIPGLFIRNEWVGIQVLGRIICGNQIGFPQTERNNLPKK